MVDFSHLSNLEVKGSKLADFELSRLEGYPVLTMAPATEANKPYFNAMMKEGQKAFKRVKHGGVTAAALSESRKLSRKLFPRFVIKSWTGVVDLKGNEVPFSKEACEDFLKALPDYIFDEVRDFAGEISNFLDEPLDVEDTAKN